MKGKASELLKSRISFLTIFFCVIYIYNFRTVSRFSIALFSCARFSADEQISKAELRLTDIADALQGDWVLLARQLNITEEEIASIRTEYSHESEQALVMLHLWVQTKGEQATGPSGLYILVFTRVMILMLLSCSLRCDAFEFLPVWRLVSFSFGGRAARSLR